MDEDTVERCEQCGFDSRRWDRRDTVNTIRDLGEFVSLSIEGSDASLLQLRPDESTWSIAEYLEHCASTLELLGIGVKLSRDHPGTDVGNIEGPVFAAQPATVEVTAAVSGAEDHAAALRDVLRGLSPEQWSNSIIANGEPVSIDWAARHAIHDVFHHLDDIAEIRHRLGDRVATMTGSVEQLNVSGGGVPKTAIDRAEINLAGVLGDSHASRQHHGRPFQAMCLFSSEAIEAFQAEGHPIAPGCVGENLTIRGLDWTKMRQGLIVEVGDVRLRLTAPAVPCSKNNRWFTDGDAQRLGYERDPARSRWYASVLIPGVIEPGDVVTAGSGLG